MINNSVIKDYVEDYILNSGQQLDGFDIDASVEDLRHVALVNNMTIERSVRGSVNDYEESR